MRRPGRRGGRQLALQRRLVAGDRPECWDLRWLPVCSSTETVLEEWLRETPDLKLQRPRAVLARHQRHGIGQRGRVWSAPPGGIWLSAAMPWPDQARGGAGLIGLALALSLSQRLERHGVPVRIKWPNDLLVDGRKLAGLLPRLVHRGNRLRLVRCGVGLNVCNTVPAGGIALAELLPAAAATPDAWVVELLRALEHCRVLAAQSPAWLAQVEARLWTDHIPCGDGGDPWVIEGLSPVGGLQLRRGDQCSEWIRWP